MNPVFAPVLGGIFSTIGDLIDDLHTSDKEKMDAQIELAKLGLDEKRIDADLMRGQIEVNKIEAQNPNILASGWRPAIGWTCAIALFCYYVPYVLAATALWVWQVVETGQLAERPDLGIADLLGLVFAMLGMSTLRTTEKVKGVAK